MGQLLPAILWKLRSPLCLGMSLHGLALAAVLGITAPAPLNVAGVCRLPYRLPPANGSAANGTAANAVLAAKDRRAVCRQVACYRSDDRASHWPSPPVDAAADTPAHSPWQQFAGVSSLVCLGFLVLARRGDRGQNEGTHDQQAVRLADRRISTAGVEDRSEGDETSSLVTGLSPEEAARTEQLRELNRQLQCEIEERRQVEIHLQQSELQYRSIVEDQTEQIVRFDVNGRIEFANRAYIQANQLTAETAVGTDLYQFLSAEEQERVRRQIADVTPEDPTGAEVLRICDAAGNVRWEQWHGRGVFDANGQLLTFQAVGRDITALKETQDRLWQSELHYRSIVEDQTEMIVRFDAEGHITFANKAYCAANGLTLDQVLGRPFYFRIHEEDRGEVLRQVAAASPQHPEQASESRAYRPDGSIAWESWTGRALFADDGRRCGFQAVGRDVSALHEAQEKLQEKERQLAHLARVSALGEMVAGISHEINQPLATIANFSSAALLLIDRESIDAGTCEKLTAWLQRIAQQTDRINAIIQRLKRFGRPGSDRQRFRIIEAIDEALIVTETRTRNVVDRIRVNCDDSVPEVHADRIQIEQVLVNLIRNACDAMERPVGTVRALTIDARHREGQVVITVRDSGPGLAEHTAAGVFDSFVTSKTEGMGIGLAISRSIIEAHGGKIRAVTEVDYGCFEFSLPVAE